MQHKLYSLLFITFLITQISFAQEYWQQEVNYEIEVSLNDIAHELGGQITIHYINNSPDTLTYIYFHLWPNAYKNETTAFAQQYIENGNTDFHYSQPGDKGYIDKLDFSTNSTKLNWSLHDMHIDIAKINLLKALQPGDSIIISTPFHVKIPKPFSRLGHVGQSYQITQWYPKPAVYDENGWHPMPYLNQGEFFSEFGSFDVKITLPSEYVVGATGNLQTQTEIEWLNSRAKDSTDFANHTSYGEDTTLKTLHYTAENVHDFAWFADRKYNVSKGFTILPTSKDTVTTWAIYYNKKTWNKALQHLDNAIHCYSKWLGDYPYQQVTAVEGPISAGGGMEYPNVTIIDYTIGKDYLEDVIIHEVGHNWWYGILASNERDYPWIDEGFNSFYEKRCTDLVGEEDSLFANTFSSKLIKGFDTLDENQLGYLFQAKRKRDQPIELHSADYTYANYGIIVYGKTALALDHLYQYLGEEEFDEVMRQFYETYKFKHIYPEDIQNFFEANASKYTGWLFNENGMRGTTRQIDYELKRVDTTHIAGTPFYELTIINKGKIKSPYQVIAYQDKEIKKQIWYDGHKPKYPGTSSYPASSGEASILFPYGEYNKIEIDGGPLEVNTQNNTIRKSALFPKVEPLRLNPVLNLDQGDRTNINYAPIAGYNKYDKIMIGAAFYNGLIYPQKIEYLFAPMFAFGSQQLNGIAALRNNYFYGYDKTLDRISFSLNARQFNYHNQPSLQKFRRIAFDTKFILSPKIARADKQVEIETKHIYINRDRSMLSNMENSIQQTRQDYLINILEATFLHNQTLHPYQVAAKLEQGNEYLKASFTWQKQINYTASKVLQIRGFIGAFFYNQSPLDVRFRLNGPTGTQDYTYSQTYFRRSDANPRQINKGDGYFKTVTNIGQSGDWLTSINFRTNLPFTNLIEAFADIGISETTSNLQYDAGFTLALIPDIAEIYIPIIISEDIREDLSSRNRAKILDRISFRINFDLLDPFEFIKNIQL